MTIGGITLAVFASRQLPLERKATAAAQFLSTRAGVGDLLDEVGDEEKPQVLKHTWR